MAGGGYYGRASDRYKNTKVTMTGSELSAKDATPAAGSTAFENSAGDLVVMDRVIIVNQSTANVVTAKILTQYESADGIVATTTSNADPITIPAGESRDTYGMLRNIVDVRLTGTAADTVEIFQQPRQSSEAF